MGIDSEQRPEAAAPSPPYRYGQRKDDYRARLRRIEGQVRGIARMVEDDSYCIDVLTQIAAAKRALEKVAVGLLDDHLRGCVTDAARDEDPRRAEEIIAEATAAIERLVRS
jgi:DNA-binding FrmR family transcriptional regulator